MRLGMGSLVQLIDILPFSQKPSCQLVRKVPRQGLVPTRSLMRPGWGQRSSGLKRLFPDKLVKLYNLSGNKGVFMDEMLKTIFRNIFQDVAGLAVEGTAEGLQGGKAHCLRLACFQNGKIRGGDTDFFSQFSARHLSAGQHYIYVDCNRHNRYSVVSPSVLAGCSSAPLR